MHFAITCLIHVYTEITGCFELVVYSVFGLPPQCVQTTLMFAWTEEQVFLYSVYFFVPHDWEQLDSLKCFLSILK